MAAAEVAGEVHVNARLEFAELSASGGEALPGLVDPGKPDALKSAALVSACLNHCGPVAVSMRKGQWTSGFAAAGGGQPARSHWGRAEACVAARRRTLRRLLLCRSLERLARKWKPEGARLRSASRSASRPPASEAGPSPLNGSR